MKNSLQVSENIFSSIFLYILTGKKEKRMSMHLKKRFFDRIIYISLIIKREAFLVLLNVLNYEKYQDNIFYRQNNLSRK